MWSAGQRRQFDPFGERPAKRFSIADAVARRIYVTILRIPAPPLETARETCKLWNF
jgi:hypothetical protein